MRIKGKLKDFVILSREDIEQKSIIKWTNMLKDDPEAEILITSEIEDLISPTERQKQGYTFMVKIKAIKVTGERKVDHA